jgi:L-fuculose-phosphate aldolase
MTQRSEAKNTSAGIVIGKRARYEAESEQIRSRVHHSDRSPAELLALACHILYRHGHSSGLAGQVTMRSGEASNEYWTQSLGLLLDEASPANMLRVGLDLTLHEGDGMVNQANQFHSWIYRSRSDIGAIVHTHASHSSALSMLGEPLAIAHMDVMALYDDVAWLPTWPGVPYGDSEGQIIADALGDKRAVLLAHHGLLTVGVNLEEATYLAVVFERAAQLHLAARAIGEIKTVDPVFGQDARQHTLQPGYAVAHFNAWTRELSRSA